MYLLVLQRLGKKILPFWCFSEWEIFGSSAVSVGYASVVVELYLDFASVLVSRFAFLVDLGAAVRCSW
jgi:hypothetical protein